MVCRCNEIGQITRDLTRLGNAQADVMRASSSNGSLDDSMGTSKAKTETAYKADTEATIQGDMDTVHNQIGPNISSLLSKIAQIISSLERKLVEYRHEDDAYHEEERKKAEEAAKMRIRHEIQYQRFYYEYISD